MNVERAIIALEEQALIAAQQGRHAAASAAHRRALALALAQHIRRPQLIAVLLNRLGQALEAAGQIPAAINMYDLGLKVLAEGSPLNLDEVVGALHSTTTELGTADDSGIPDLRGAGTVEVLDDAEADPALPLKLLLNLGHSHLRQSQEGPALHAYQTILARPENADAPVLHAHALTHIALIQRRRGKHNEAYALLGEALDLLDKYAQPVEKRRTLAIMADIYRERGQSELALSFYRQSLALHARADDPHGEAQARTGYGHLLLEMKQYAEAQRVFERTLELLRHESAVEMLWPVHWGLGRCLLASGEPARAAESFRRSLELLGTRRMELRTAEGTSAFVTSVQDVFDDLIEAHLAHAQIEAGSWPAVLAVIEEARERALYDLMGSTRRKRLPEGREIRPARFRPFAERVQGTLPQPVVDSPAYGADDAASPPGPPPLSRLLFHVLRDRVVVIAVSPHGDARGHSVPWNRAELVTRIRAVRRALQIDDALRGVRGGEQGSEAAPSAPAEYAPLLAEWYDALLDPIANVLPADGTPVVIEPHGALWLLPFAALIDEKGDWVASRWPLLYAPSWQTLAEIRNEADYGGPNSLNALIVADPTIPPLKGDDTHGLRLEQLPGAREEAQAVADLFPERKTLLVGQRAERQVVDSLLGKHGIVHLATHSIALADSPLASFVVLGGSGNGGGLLTAWQIMSLALPADLVTLSACQVGLGKASGDGMIGLSRAFLLAGARTVLASQWNVSDRATTRLMKSFYHWYIAGDDKALALQRAMRELRERPGYEHPRFWAPFMVIGAEI